ncbi:MAG: hypothetical protein KF838_00040 [Phycisphaeraceae bacterium]|nr:MAG: hypothetical protein KF838_00040 [Phycisphaeraceae bacterium]
MFEWTPPPRSIAVLCIDAFDGPYHESLAAPGRMTVTQRDVALAEFLAQFGLKIAESFYRIPLDDSRLPSLLAALAESQLTRTLALKAAWIEEPPPRVDDPAAWFELQTGPGEFKSPRRPATSSHFGWREGQRVASETFRRAAVDCGLTGLAWLPLEDARPEDPMPWYEMYAERPIGRGLDHPLIDPVKLDAAKVKQGFDLSRRWGEPIAWLPHLRDDTVLRSDAATALARPTTPHFRVAGPTRFVREHLPPTDFAYSGWGFKPDTGPGHKGRPVRSICCNARARLALIESGAMKPRRFLPIATLPAAKSVSAILDRMIAGPLPPPVYTPDEASTELLRRQRSIGSRSPVSQPMRFASVEAAIDHLSTRHAAGSLPWDVARGSGEFEEIAASPLFSETPLSWQRLAPFLPLETSFADPDTGESFDFSMQPPEWNTWLAYEPGAGTPEDEPSTDDLVVACTPYGDWYAFRRQDPLMPDDARLVRWDHETTQIGDEWASTVLFVSHLLDICDRATRA